MGIVMKVIHHNQDPSGALNTGMGLACATGILLMTEAVRHFLLLGVHIISRALIIMGLID